MSRIPHTLAVLYDPLTGKAFKRTLIPANNVRPRFCPPGVTVDRNVAVLFEYNE